MSFPELIGRQVTGLFINQEKKALIVKTTTGDVNLYAAGECCSSTWVEHATGVNCLLGASILDAKEVELERVEEDEFEIIQHYSLKIRTDKGRTEFEYRNESNGYYGGSIEVRESDWSELITSDGVPRFYKPHKDEIDEWVFAEVVDDF